MPMKKDCVICEAHASFEREGLFEQDGRKHESAIVKCTHDGGRFLWCGSVPKNQHEADILIRYFLRFCGITNKRGAKATKPTYLEIAELIDKLPAIATLSEVAGYLNVSERTIQRVLEAAYTTFQDLQAEIKGAPGTSRLKKRFDKRLKRRR